MGKRLVFLGPPGSGKGTQATFVAEREGIPAISTGEMLREAVDAGTPLGLKVKDVLAGGKLVDDALMASLVRERLDREDAREGFLLDGYPRTIAQAEALDKILEDVGGELDAVVFIDVPKEELVRRALERKRKDDTPEVIEERLAVYGNKTAPLIGYYKDRGLLKTIDGNRSIEEVTSMIEEALGG